MTAFPGRSSVGVPLRLIFDGQSHNSTPGDANELGLGYSYPWQITRGRGIPWSRVSVAGASWTTLATTAATRLWPLCDRATATILLMSGGTADIDAADSGAALYADEVAYADAARAAGVTKVIGVTLIGSTSFDSGENTARTDHNALLIADAEDAFDAVADVDAAFVSAYGATYWTDEDVLFDGTHIWGASATLYAATVAPVLDAVMASL